MSKFNKDLKRGQRYEKIALGFFEYEKCYCPEGLHKEYDFILDDTLKVEVKADFISYLTHNIVIEYKCNGKNSGIRATTADYWVYFVAYGSDYEAYKIDVESLKNICKNHGHKIRGGDGMRSQMYIFKKAHLKKFLIKKSW